MSGVLWEEVGRAWAEHGQFLEAIKAYRQSMRSRRTSVSAMEQLANLLVRYAVRIWQVRLYPGTQVPLARVLASGT